MDYSLDPVDFSMKYNKDYPKATGKEGRAKYEEYKEFYVKHYRDYPGTATDYYEEFLQTLGKRDKEAVGLLLVGAELKHSRARLYREIVEKHYYMRWPELAVAEAFRIPYQNPLNIVERFQNYIDKKHAYWLSNKINRVPYRMVFQSSGYGKTRLIEQLTTKIPTLYVCLRPKESTEYPPVTPIASEIFNRLNDVLNGQEWRFMFIIWHIIKKLHEYSLTKSAIDLWKQQLNNKWCLKFWSEVSTASEKWLTIEENDANLSKGKFPFYDAYNSNNRVKIILYIDEAQYFTHHVPDRNRTPFRILRRAMKHIAWNGFFAIFLDTFSKISNFASSLSEDPSLRDDEAQLLLFHPFVRLTTMDIFEKMMGGPAGTSEEDQIVQLAKLGRPLIYSYLKVKGKSSSTQTALKRLVTLLQNKLFGRARSFDDSHKKDLSSIAILSVLICLDISPQSKIASELVGSYMATYAAVSKDRSAYAEKRFCECRRSWRSGSTNHPDSCGKFIQENEDWKSSGITVKQLIELLDPAAIDELQSFVDATVAFTHFIPIRNNPGVDIMIPVKLSEDRYSYILIQVKNYASNNQSADQSYPESGTSKLKSRFVFRKSDLKHHEEKYITLYWQLGFQG
ncbi:8476_t:CDS:2 [Funneliformis mosseae]|uniref:8476_t:CDS:1 n=1 Tax=Funneliformis mosseae TaxID=27381 RepID=A0A9N9H5J1_FUNMO|nr:8476_t:CDS:2 [Funneliformis mosseae]